jgi:SAM-dependent methyltransferase
MPIDNDGVACEPRPDCIGCGTAGTLLHSGLTDALFGARGVWSVRRCANPACGLGWLDPQPRPDQIGRFYESYWTHGPADPSVQPGAYRTGGSRRLVKAILAALLFWRRISFRGDLLYLQGMAPGRLLDVGCGNGQFLAAAAAAGWRATGLDFDAQAIAAARTLPGVEAEVGDLLDRRFDAAGFDAVVLNNVIEHVPDPVAVFAECARLLRPGGRLVMVTPNLDALGHRIFGRDWRGLEPPRHLFLFTARALRRFARRAGFAGADICSSTGQTAPDWPMLRTSMEAAARAGRSIPPVDLRALKWRERLLDLAGLSRGEWVVLVARR